MPHIKALKPDEMDAASKLLATFKPSKIKSIIKNADLPADLRKMILHLQLDKRLTKPAKPKVPKDRSATIAEAS